MLRNKHIIKSGRAVSPVIGVILMVGIVVALGAVVGGAVLGIGTGIGDTAPNTQFDASYDTESEELTVTHIGGDTIDADQLSYSVAGDGFSGEVTAGTSEKFSVPAGETFSIQWESESGETTATIFEYDTSTEVSGVGVPGQISGTVSINPGIEGATVEAYDSSGFVTSDVTDVDGNYELDVPDGFSGDVVVSVEGFESESTDNALYAGGAKSDISGGDVVDFDFGESDVENVVVDGDEISVVYGIGDGGSAQISNVEQLQAMGSSLERDYTLVRDIDASETSAWNGGDGFVPIGSSSNMFEGTFDGSGNFVFGLTIDRPAESNVGLFGANDGTIERVGVVGVLIDGDLQSGGLVGDNRGVVTESYVTGSVDGGLRTGGLVGENGGDISNTYVSVTVNGEFDSGGLVGDNGGTVTDSYWDTDSTVQSDGVGNGGGDVTGLESGQMIGSNAESNMGAFDFNSVWVAVDGDYPQLIR